MKSNENEIKLLYNCDSISTISVGGNCSIKCYGSIKKLNKTRSLDSSFANKKL